MVPCLVLSKGVCSIPERSVPEGEKAGKGGRWGGGGGGGGQYFRRLLLVPEMVERCEVCWVLDYLRKKNVGSQKKMATCVLL